MGDKVRSMGKRVVMEADNLRPFICPFPILPHYCFPSPRNRPPLRNRIYGVNRVNSEDLGQENENNSSLVKVNRTWYKYGEHTSSLTSSFRKSKTRIDARGWPAWFHPSGFRELRALFTIVGQKLDTRQNTNTYASRRYAIVSGQHHPCLF